MADPKEDPFLDDPEAMEPEEEVEPSAEDVELDALRAERDDLKDKLLRALADAENARKRAAKDRQEAQAYGGTRIARDLLPVYDNLHRALSAAKEDESGASTALIEGVELTLKELMQVFDRHGVTTIEPQVGDLIQVSAAGFLLHDRLLRPAQVGVSSTPEG